MRRTSHGGLALVAACLAAAPLRAVAGQEVEIVRRLRPAQFRFTAAAGGVLRALWEESARARAERVACLGGELRGDTVHIDRVLPVAVTDADSMGMSAEASVERCGPPEWRGTAHTHIAEYRDGEPSKRFSAQDRQVMSLWRHRWREDGYFCVLFSPTGAHCEVWTGATP